MKSVAVMAKGKRYVDLAEYKRVEAQCKLLLKALKKYGHHTMDCMLNDVLRRGRGHRDYACKCGFARALTAPEPNSEPK